MKLWEPKRKCPKAIPRHLQNHVVWSRILKCSVKSYVTKPITKCHFSVRSAMASQFCVRRTSKRWFLKIVQVTMRHDPLMSCRNPCRLYIHLVVHKLHSSLKHSVRQTWTSSAFSTNESAWSVMVTGSQSRVWSGPKTITVIFENHNVFIRNLCIDYFPM